MQVETGGRFLACTYMFVRVSIDCEQIGSILAVQNSERDRICFSLVTALRLVPRLKMCGALSPLPLNHLLAFNFYISIPF